MIPVRDSRNRSKRFVNGHNTKGKRKHQINIIRCACGCGAQLEERNKWGQIRRFIQGHFKYVKKGELNPNWKGGKRDHSDGYILIRYPDHPRAKGNNGYVYEHILVMEDYLGRYVMREEAVHHINEKKDDNRIENLELLLNSEHTSYHKLDNHKDVSDRVCYNCGSNITRMKQPYGNNKTPYPHWYHLPWDKENWYCHACYDKLT